MDSGSLHSTAGKGPFFIIFSLLLLSLFLLFYLSRLILASAIPLGFLQLGVYHHQVEDVDELYVMWRISEFF